MLFSSLFFCTAQSTVYDINEDRSNKAENSYFKDLNGDLDGYEGTYVYTNGTTSFKLVLKKKIKSYNYYYKDLIVGEFQFIKDGVELYNSLANININYTNAEANYSIKGNMIIIGKSLGCDDCAVDEKRLSLGYGDERAHRIIGIDIRKAGTIYNPFLKVHIYDRGTTISVNPDPVKPVPEFGNYIMIKQ